MSLLCRWILCCHTGRAQHLGSIVLSNRISDGEVSSDVLVCTSSGQTAAADDMHVRSAGKQSATVRSCVAGAARPEFAFSCPVCFPDSSRNVFCLLAPLQEDNIFSVFARR